VPAEARARSWPRRQLAFLGLGVALAGVLAALLFAGPGTPSPSAGAATAGPAPGIGPAGANLLDLNVLPADQPLMAPGFHLVDQYGTPTSLSQFRGKVVVWSMNDDRCTDLCALYAQDIVAAEHDLGAAASHVVFLALNANPFYPSPASLRAWSVRNDLEHLHNWVYVTGTPRQLKATWSAYHVTVELNSRARTVVHDATLEFIDPSGRTRAIGDFTTGPISTAYYAHTLAVMANDLLPRRERVAVGGPAVGSPSTSGATLGDSAPRFSLPELGTGATRSLGALEGKPLVVNFWASTCGICIQEMPALQRVDDRFGGRVEFVGIDVADPRQAAASFARRAGVRYALLADRNGTVASSYRVEGLPVTFIVGRHGTILARHEGALTVNELMAVLQLDFQGLVPGH
jgi:cytochrome oxidase Cu insertion factor (SCO1/SenC/PrrC family)/peroxiredoxin